MKSILYFYPHKFSRLTDGCHTRIVSILKYFKSRGFVVDMICFEDTSVESSYILDNKLVNCIHYVKKSNINQLSFTNNIFRKLGRIINYFIPTPKQETLLPNLVNDSLNEIFLGLTTQNDYSAILITYSYWADVVKTAKNNGSECKMVIDPNDFLTLQQFYFNPQLSMNQIGTMFGSELDRMSQFDDILHISHDEYLLFSNFITTSKHHFIPQFFEKRKFNEIAQYKYDVLFIGSSNPYNIEGIKWFFEFVYPLLSKGITIGIAGNICKYVNTEGNNVIKLGFVEDTEKLFAASRCTICPLKKGSGIKIKVVESLSFGLPVVSTLKGLDGFLNKEPVGGVLVADEPAIFAYHINNLTFNKEYYKEQCAIVDEIFNENFTSEKNYAMLDKVFFNIPDDK